MMAKRGRRAPLRPLRPRVFWSVVKAAGLLPMSALFGLLYVAVAAILVRVEPAIESWGDAVWFLFTVVTTVGLGDFTCTTLLGRAATIALSINSLFYFALLTGAVVSYCSEIMRARRDESIAEFMDQLEHLPELNQDELAQISEHVKRQRY